MNLRVVDKHLRAGELNFISSTRSTSSRLANNWTLQIYTMMINDPPPRERLTGWLASWQWRRLTRANLNDRLGIRLGRCLDVASGGAPNAPIVFHTFGRVRGNLI